MKLELTREEVFLTHRGRPHSEIALKIGLRARRRDHRAATPRSCSAAAPTAATGLVTILYAGALLHALYQVGAVRYRGWRVYTNLPPCGAMRGTAR